MFLLSSLVQVLFHMGLKRLVSGTERGKMYLCERLLGAAGRVTVSR